MPRRKSYFMGCKDGRRRVLTTRTLSVLDAEQRLSGELQTEKYETRHGVRIRGGEGYWKYSRRRSQLLTISRAKPEEAISECLGARHSDASTARLKSKRLGGSDVARGGRTGGDGPPILEIFDGGERRTSNWLPDS